MHTVHTMVNAMWDTGTKPKDLNTAILRPIYKKGKKSLPKNYRPISLLTIIDKIYATLLREDLTRWTEENNIIPKECGGIIKGASAEEQIFNLHETLHNYPTHIHAAFIDVSKAFDSVNRAKLWERLKECGIDENLLFALRGLYRSTKQKIKVGEHYSRIFESTKGVRQGCPLSPLLFTLYISDLPGHLKNHTKGVPIQSLNHEEEIRMLSYIDDIVILARTNQELERTLDILNKYGQEKELPFNYDKCQVVVFEGAKLLTNHPTRHYQYGSHGQDAKGKQIASAISSSEQK